MKLNSTHREGASSSIELAAKVHTPCRLGFSTVLFNLRGTYSTTEDRFEAGLRATRMRQGCDWNSLEDKLRRILGLPKLHAFILNSLAGVRSSARAEMELHDLAQQY